MKIFLNILIFVIATKLYSHPLETIYASAIDQNDYRYEETIEAYQGSDDWRIWNYPIGKVHVTSELKQQGDNTYQATNLQDDSLNTAWVEGEVEFGVGVRISFTFEYDVDEFYGSAFQFFGKVNLFNGYCKNLTVWEENSRVKTLKVYYNNQAFCLVELIDTWQFQSFDISRFFVDRGLNKYIDAPYEIKTGDTLSFEITEVYKGTKYKDTALSEFNAEGAKN